LTLMSNSRRRHDLEERLDMHALLPRRLEGKISRSRPVACTGREVSPCPSQIFLGKLMTRPLPGHAEFALKACQEVPDPLFFRKLMDRPLPGHAEFALTSWSRGSRPIFPDNFDGWSTSREPHFAVTLWIGGSRPIFPDNFDGWSTSRTS